MRSLAAPLCLLLALYAAPAAGDEISESFDGPSLDPDSFVITAPDGYDVTLMDGEALFTKDAAAGNGFARITTVFTIKGDFSVTVMADRINAAGNAAIGLVSSHLPAGTGFTDVYFRGTGQVVSNIFVDPVHAPVVLNDSANPVTFRIRRIGNRIVHECDPGFGYVHVSEATDPVLAGPVRIGLFLGQEEGQAVAHAASFDDLFVQGDVFSPPCGDGVVEGEETCDDDDPSWSPGQYCGTACTVLACGDADDSGGINATDALFVLRTSTGLSTCDDCVCDVDSSGGANATSVTDALRVLQNAIGLPTELACPACT